MREIDQLLKVTDRFLGGCRHVHVFHVETQVTLADKSVRTLINLLNQGWFNLDAQLLSVLKLLVEDSDAFANGLVIFDVGDTVDEVSDVELFFKLQVLHLGFVEQHHVNVSSRVFNPHEYFVKFVEFICRHCISEVLLRLEDDFSVIVASADGSFGQLTLRCLVNPGFRGAQLAIEVAAVLAVELHVSEIKLGLVAVFT